jgi:NADH:ubiquinone oxidoreductase subunit 5 (subunit L)/multisubunit Na+/H+ antiporter MnhA subunit
MAEDGLRRFLGGSPLGVLIKLILLSILVGFVLTVIGLDPRNIFWSIETLVRSIFNLGFDAFEWLWRYLLLGAVIVIPIWLIMRVVKSRKR